MRLYRHDGVELAVVRPESGGFPRHSHDEYVLSVSRVGWERVRLDRASFEVGTEEVTCYNPGQVQSCVAQTPEGVPWSCVSLYVTPAAVEALTGGPAPEFDRPVVPAPALRVALLDAAAARLDRPGAGLDRDLLHERLMVLLLRLFAAGRRRRQRSAEPEPRIAAVLDRLRSDLSRPPRLEHLADQAGMSREHLIRAFTRATGCPPYAWHLQARLAEGRRLLRLGRPVAEVAHRLGFADQAHFHKHFRAAYATTPGRYRAALRSGGRGHEAVNI